MANVSVPRPTRRLRLPRLDLGSSGGLEGRLPIVAGVLLALVAATLVYVGQQHARDQANAPEEVTPVVVASANVPQGTLLNSSNIPGMFKVTRVPASGVPQDAIAALSTLDGQITTTALAPGDRVLASSLTPPPDSTVSGARAALLPPGDVAIILPVNDNISVGGAIVPTDRVDVIATMPVSTATDGGKSSESLVTQAILRDVRVLATGYRTRPPAASSASGQPAPIDTNPTPYSTLTLALPPQDAVIVQHLLAQNVRLALALRRPGEQTQPTAPVTTADIVRRLGVTQGSTGQAPSAPAQAPTTAQAPSTPAQAAAQPPSPAAPASASQPAVARSREP